jgi:beta-lactamase regulating signal transducer with metallopeptidase domain
VEALLSIALVNAVTATLLAAVVAAMARVCRRPAVLHALWLLVLLKLVTPPLVPVTVNWPRMADVEVVASRTESSAEIAVLSSSAEPAETVADEPPSESEPDAPPLAPRATVSGRAVLLTLWLSGSLLWWTIACVRLLRFHRLLREARIAPENVREQARRLAVLLGLRRCPSISFVAAAISPMLLALGFSPRLLLPVDLWTRLSAEQQDTLLAHELAHLCRGDHWIRRLEFLVLGLYWWHPVVWWARRRLQEAEEECCDARVVAVLPSAASAYASALLETVTFLSQTRTAALLGASGAGQVPLLKRRLTMIMTANPSRKSSRIGFWIAFGLGGLILPLTLGAAQTDPPAPARTPPSEDRKVQPGNFALPLDQVHATSCMSCHTAFSNPHPEKPVPADWLKYHDEYVRLAEKMKTMLGERQGAQERQGAERNRLARTQREADQQSRAEQIEQLQDEIELLRVEVKIKEAHLSATKVLLDASRPGLQNMKMTNQHAPGSVSQEAIREAALKVETYTAQLRIKEAELQEPLVRLKQAERRLARLKGPSKPAATPARPGAEQRLMELEKKLNQVLDEMKALQQDMRRAKPGDSPRREPSRP